jgi:hypothetical protein
LAEQDLHRPLLDPVAPPLRLSWVVELAGQATLGDLQAHAHDFGETRRYPLTLVAVGLPGPWVTYPRVEDAEEDGRHKILAGRDRLLGAVVAVPLPQTVDVLGLVAAHLPVLQPRLGPLRPSVRWEVSRRRLKRPLAFSKRRKVE